MPSYTPLNGPASVGDAVRPLAQLNESDVGTLAGMIGSERSFSPRTSEIEILAETAKLNVDAIEYLFVALSVLYNHVASAVSSGIDHEAAVELTASELSRSSNWEEKESDVIKRRLNILLKYNDNHNNFRKIERIRAGFAPHAIGFSSFVELRPKFSDEADGGLKIDGYVPTIEFRITTDSKSDKQFVFQLTQEALDEMRKAVERLSMKFDVLKQGASGTLKIFDL